MLGRDLPEDVLMEIQSRLPVKTLMRFKCISKSWYALTTDPYFITKHLTSHNPHTGAIFACGSLWNLQRICWLSNETLELSGDEVHFSQLFQHALCHVDIVGPCNGILCLAATLKGKNGKAILDFEIVLWNPATRESKMLPPMDLLTPTFNSKFGFGYDAKTNDYKVVRILRVHSHWKVVVYSLSSNSWRVIDSTPNPSFRFDAPDFPAYLNGVYYWCSDPVCRFLLSFDMSNEVFQEVPAPLNEEYSSRRVDYSYMGVDYSSMDVEYSSMQLTVVNDSVTLILECRQCTFFSLDMEVEEWIEIWVLNDSGVKRPWTKISSFKFGGPPDTSIASTAPRGWFVNSTG